MKNILLFINTLLLVTNLYSLTTIQENNNNLILTTLYGTTHISEPVLIDLIKHPAFKRLKDIQQYGVVCHAQSDPKYTRYQHSLGVFFLTRKFNAPLEEQIAALLHDVSHTVFSHVGDILFASNYRAGKQSYQDNIHAWYLTQSGITAVLEHYCYRNICDETTKKTYHCFEQDLPNLCADRIEYNITGAFIDRLINQDELNWLLSKLHFENDQWFFDDITAAKKFGLISLQLSESRWGSAKGTFVDHHGANALKRALELDIITTNDIHFSTDSYVWQKLISSTDPYIVQQIKNIQACNHCCKISTSTKSDLHLTGKFSGTDPLVLIEGSLHRLSAIDSTYKKEFDRVKNIVTRGWYINIINQ